jgi:hypothetical protein
MYFFDSSITKYSENCCDVSFKLLRSFGCLGFHTYSMSRAEGHRTRIRQHRRTG